MSWWIVRDGRECECLLDIADRVNQIGETGKQIDR
jgi:hypothetical protein